MTGHFLLIYDTEDMKHHATSGIHDDWHAVAHVSIEYSAAFNFLFGGMQK